MIFGKNVGIDLGTANTLVYVKGKGIIVNEPSMVALDSKTDKVIAVGTEAKEMLGKTPGEIRIVRPLKNGVINDFKVAEAMLKYFIKKAKKQFFFPKGKIMIAVPSGISAVEKRAVIDSAKGAHIHKVYLVAEPLSAAIGVDLPIEKPTGNMVIDIGGGTTEIAVISLSCIVSSASIAIAGDEIDRVIIQYLRRKYNVLIGEQTAESIKIQIGSAYPLEHEEEMIVKGKNLVEGIPKTIKLNSGEIREALQVTIKAIVDAVKVALENTPPELASDIIENGVIMVGGGSQLKGLDICLEHETGLPIKIAEVPTESVVTGTGKLLDNLKSYSKLLLSQLR